MLEELVINKIKRYRVKLRIAGDIHHYTRHEVKYGDDGETLIVSGGGGAFMHSTNSPFEKDITFNDNIYERVEAYPNPKVSEYLEYDNLFRFRIKNIGFDIIGGMLYYLAGFSLFPYCKSTSNDDAKLHERIILMMHECFMTVLFNSKVSLIIWICIIIGFYLWIGNYVALYFRIPITIIHAFIHITTIIVLFITMETMIQYSQALDIFTSDSYSSINIFTIHINAKHNLCQNKSSTINTLTYYLSSYIIFHIMSTPIVSLYLGIYAYISGIYMGRFDNLSAGLKIEGYKNFLRFHIQKNGTLKCYVIGISKSPSKWIQNPNVNENDSNIPSYKQSNPSKWIPNGNMNQFDIVDIVDTFEI